MLFGLNLAGVATVAALASPRLRAVGRTAGRAGRLRAGASELAGGAAIGAPIVAFSEVDWRTLPVGGRLRQAGGAAVGLAAAVPVAAVFGSLLMQADPVFDRLVVPPLNLDVGRSRRTLGACCPVGVAGGRPAARRCAVRQLAVDAAARRGSLGLLEVGVVLAVVDLLFLAFVAVQFRYLFGGNEQVRAGHGHELRRVRPARVLRAGGGGGAVAAAAPPG